MLAFNDQTNKIVSYLYNNAIVDTGSSKVIGVVLGNCVFGIHRQVVGKFFNNTLYNERGEVVARIEQMDANPPYRFSPADCMGQAWELATRVRDHICPWVEPTDNWSSQSIQELLKAHLPEKQAARIRN